MVGLVAALQWPGQNWWWGKTVPVLCCWCAHYQQAHVTTKTQSEPSVVAWIVGGLLCFIGDTIDIYFHLKQKKGNDLNGAFSGFWPCACIPCCVDSMQQVWIQASFLILSLNLFQISSIYILLILALTSTCILWGGSTTSFPLNQFFLLDSLKNFTQF